MGSPSESNKLYRLVSNWTGDGVGHSVILLLLLVIFGPLVLLWATNEPVSTLWPLWAVVSALGLAYLAWQTDHWPGVRDRRLGLEVAMGGAGLGVVGLVVKGIFSVGLLSAGNNFFIRWGGIVVVGVFLGAMAYFWFYLFTTKAQDPRAEALRLLSIAALGAGLWGPVFFSAVDISFAFVHFITAIWAGVIASGQAVAEDSIARQLSD